MTQPKPKNPCSLPALPPQASRGPQLMRGDLLAGTAEPQGQVLTGRRTKAKGEGLRSREEVGAPQRGLRG